MLQLPTWSRVASLSACHLSIITAPSTVTDETPHTIDADFYISWIFISAINKPDSSMFAIIRNNSFPCDKQCTCVYKGMLVLYMLLYRHFCMFMSQPNLDTEPLHSWRSRNHTSFVTGNHSGLPLTHCSSCRPGKSSQQLKKYTGCGELQHHMVSTLQPRRLPWHHQNPSHSHR